MIVGIDEAGRGPLAGPVIAGAVILDPQYEIMGLMDSKQLTPKKREQLALQIKEKALAWGIGEASVEEIDQYNIFQATFLAMQRAFEALMTLNIKPQQAWIDGKYSPILPIPTQAIIKGDQKVPCISAASILAKVTRDGLMQELDVIYPEYGLAQHKGYGTQKHLIALKAHGYTPCHRLSFSPVRQCIKRESV